MKDEQQLQLELRTILHSDRDDGRVIEDIIALYGAEFTKANDEIARLRKENQLINFIITNGLQVWPERDRKTKEIKLWTVQSAFKPFLQVTRATLQAALDDLRDKIIE